MRSPIGPILVLLGLGTTVVLVLLLVQTMGLRSDLDDARAEFATLRAQVDAQEAPMTADDLTRGLAELETEISDALVATGADGDLDGDPSQPAGGDGTLDELVDRLDEVLERIAALDRRVDEICDSVPVC